MPDEIEIEANIAEQTMESAELIASVERLGKVSKLKPDLQQTVLDLFAYSLHQSRGYLFWEKPKRHGQRKQVLR